MGIHKIRKGLDLPITGEPEQRIENAPQPRHVALVTDDYVGMKPTMLVAAGDDVRRGQALFEDKKTPGVRYTAPASGRVAAIHRGARRALQSVVIQLDSGELAGGSDGVSFAAYTGKNPRELSREQARDLLLESGLWTSLRMRPFSKVADPETSPHSIFVTAMDSNPLAPAVDVVLAGKEAAFERGLQAVARLTDGPVYVCKQAGSAVRAPSDGRFRVEEFQGPHPAGTVGLHIHLLDPVDRHKVVWHVGYQDLIAIGRLFGEGVLDVERVVSLAGPLVRRPRLLRTRRGASTIDLAQGELGEGEARVISGPVFSGRTASGSVFGYLGRYHQQITVLREGREREFAGWLSLGFGKYSTINTFISKLIPGKKFALTTSANGSHRAMVPIGMYERVFPMDILPTFLLRTLLVGDLEKAEELGVLELDEEDLGLCSFVCPSKVEYGPLLRQVLTIIEKEG
jgi:Na+-transporting NADH:ubiquinone oxidoreductase subunit A